jgi:PKD repeat protein
MKKLLLTATAILSVAVSLKAQEIKPCATYEAREYYLKNVPGYAAKLNAAEAASRAEYQAFLQQSKTAKTSSVQPTYTVPVVFHILHQGESLGTAPNINDNECVLALAQVNSDYARLGSDTNTIDPKFKPLYEDAHMHFALAQKDPNGNCTSGIVHHYDNKTIWNQSDLSNYQYSTYGVGNWNPSKYLNIYIVKSIVESSPVVGGGIIVGYTHLPGTAPISASDAIVYRNDFLTGGLSARSLSHEIGHWFGLSHTFGSTNNPGFECGNDDIDDTPQTTGFFSTCPKPGYNYTVTPTVTTPVDSSDVVRVKFGKLDCITPLNSLLGKVSRNLFTMVATTVTPIADTIIRNASGTAGGYSNFTEIYGNDFNSNTTNSISITSVAKSTDNNYVGMYMDYNNNGSFSDAGEAIYISNLTVNNFSLTPNNVLGTYTFSTMPVKINKTYTLSTSPGVTFTTTPDSFIIAPAVHKIPVGRYGLYRMRVISSSTPITGPTMTPASGEIEEYNLNIGTTLTGTATPNFKMATCDSVRPNIENIMDYSNCPKMFTKQQNDKVRLSATSTTANRSTLISYDNLVFTGLVNRVITTNTVTGQPDTTYVPITASPCAPVADFAINKTTTCAGQSILFNSTSYNGTGFTYAWEFEGGSPSTSTLAAQSVTYSTAGTYSVSLTVTNAYGASTKTISTITANWNAPVVSLPYTEDFESGQWWPAGWVVPTNNDVGSPTWELSNYGAGTLAPSTKSALLPNANGAFSPFGNGENVDVIELPAFDFSNVTNIGFQFAYSFARKPGVTQDTFKVQYSLDCGGTWKNFLASPTAQGMAATGGTVTAPYIPWSALTTSTTTNPKWATASIISVGTAAIANKRDVKIRFWFKNEPNGQSQNLYLDNINLSGTVGIHEFENLLGLSIYPNPTNGASTVEFTSPNNSKVNVLVYDVTGRVVEQNELNANAGVANKHLVNASGKLTAGIYFVSLTIGNDKVVKKIIIN